MCSVVCGGFFLVVRVCVVCGGVVRVSGEPCIGGVVYCRCGRGC